MGSASALTRSSSTTKSAAHTSRRSRSSSKPSFNVTVDYLLIDTAERRPLNAPSSHVDARLADLDQLSDDERTTITNVIDALVTKAKLRLITGGAG